MPQDQPYNPLHGITLEKILTELVEHYGWQELGRRIVINCFNSNPSISSSLKFLRRTPWARDKVESLYLELKCFTETSEALDNCQVHAQPGMMPGWGVGHYDT